MSFLLRKSLIRRIRARLSLEVADADAGGVSYAAMQRHRAVYDASPDMIFLHARDGTIVDMNDNALTGYGYRREDLGMLSIGMLSGPDQSMDLASDLLARALQGEPLDFPWTARRRDGSEFPVEVRLRRVDGLPDAERGVVAVVRDMTARRQAEDALRQSVKLFESAFEYAAIGMALVATDGRWLKVNPALCRITGYPEHELLRLDFQAITHPDDLDADLASVKQLLAGAIETYQMEKRYITKTGDIVWVLLSVSLARDAHDEPLYFVSQIQDISARKAAERQLRHELEFSDAVFNTIGSVAMVLDRDGRIVEFNQAAQALTGFGLIEILGKYVWDVLLPPEQIEAVREVFGRLTGGDFPNRYENHWMTRDGERRLLAWSNTVLQDDDGKVTYVIATGIDITEQRNAEQRLRNSEERFRFVAQSASDLIVEWHVADDRMTWFGDVDAALGYQTGEFPRTSRGWFEHIHPDDQAAVETAINRYWETGEPLQIEYRIRTRDGRWRIWEDRGTGILDTQGRRARFIGAVTDITERRAAESAVARMGRLMRQSVSEIYAFNAGDLRFTQVSQGACDNLGYSEAELCTMTPVDLKQEYTRAAFEALLEPLRRGAQEAIRFRTMHRRKNGTLYPVEVQLQLSRQESPPAFLAVIEDITIRQQAEQGRLRALERLHTLKNLDRAILSARSIRDIAAAALSHIHELLDAYRIGICVFDFDKGTFRVVAESGHGIADITPENELPIGDMFLDDVGSLGLGEVLSISDLSSLERLPAILRQFIEYGVCSVVHVPLIVQDRLFGVITLMSRQVAAYTPEQIEIAREVATSISIAFQQARLNEEIRRHADELEQRVKERTLALARANEDLQNEIDIRVGAEAVLRDREQRFRRYYDLGLIGMAVTSVAKGWVDFNDRLCEILGYSAAELRRLTWADITHPDDLATDVGQFNRVLAGEIEGYTLDKRFMRKDGTVVYASISARCLRTADGTVDYFVAFVQDITERKHAEEILRRSNEELAAANRDLESFSYSVSHDLRSPLRSIDGFSMALLEDYGDRLDPRGRDYFERIRRAAQTMGRLIDDLLQLARVSRQVLQLTVLDMSVLCTTVLEELRGQDPARQVTWHIEPGLCVMADASLFRAALVNILGNAWKFTAENPAARIEVGQAGPDDAQYFYIKDNGVGFDMQYVEKVFLPFQRLHDKDRFEGTGIGLATVARIISRHNGRIWAESMTGVGTEIRFTLPTDRS